MNIDIGILFGKNVSNWRFHMPPLKIVEGVKSKDHPLHGTWSNMRDRCNNPNNKDYPFYGAIGVRVCRRWDNFSLFVEDVNKIGPRPEGFTLDRIDSRKNYEPKNIRWASKIKQARNQKMRRTNQSGCSGVNQMSCGGYVARIYHKGERIYLGYFSSLDDAVAARKRAEKELDWHNVE